MGESLVVKRERERESNLGNSLDRYDDSNNNDNNIATKIIMFPLNPIRGRFCLHGYYGGTCRMTRTSTLL